MNLTIHTMSAKPKQSPPQPPKRIDKNYWLNKGYEMVDGGLKRVYEQIKGVNQYVNGLLATYVLATVIDAVFLQIDIWWKVAIIMAPVVAVKWVAYYSNIAVLPEAKTFYPDSADSCEITYYQYLDDALAHLKKMKNFALTSTLILLAVLVIVTAWTIQTKQEAASDEDKLVEANQKLEKATKTIDSLKALDIYYLKTALEKESKQIVLQGMFPKDKRLKLGLFNSNDDALLNYQTVLLNPVGGVHTFLDYSAYEAENDSVLLKAKYPLADNEDRIIAKWIVLKEKE